MQTRTLPDDIETLKRLIIARDATVEQLQRQLTIQQQESLGLCLLIEKLKLQIARFKRTQFGQSSERYPGELMQLELLVEELEANQTQTRISESDPAVLSSMPSAAVKDQPRRTLPAHLPRQRIEPSPSCTCSTCGPS
jgi:transposase